MPKTHFTPSQAAQIRRLHKEGMTVKQIAYNHGVTDVCIHYIVAGQTHKYAGDGYTHWLMADEVPCGAAKDDPNLVEYSEHVIEVDCPDCLNIARLVSIHLDRVTAKVHWWMVDEIACDSVQGDISRAEYSQHVASVTCPDCLKIVDIIKAGFETKDSQPISELWKDMDDDN